MPITYPPNRSETARKIVDAVVQKIRTDMTMNETNCYASIVSGYIEGQHKQVIQIVPGSVRPDEFPEGGWLGGGVNIKRMMIQMTYWHALPIDWPQRSEEILRRELQGSLDFIESIHALFRFTTLANELVAGETLLEPMRYEGETSTEWYDIDRGITFRTLNYSVLYPVCWDDNTT